MGARYPAQVLTALLFPRADPAPTCTSQYMNWVQLAVARHSAEQATCEAAAASASGTPPRAKPGASTAAAVELGSAWRNTLLCVSGGCGSPAPAAAGAARAGPSACPSPRGAIISRSSSWTRSSSCTQPAAAAAAPPHGSTRRLPVRLHLVSALACPAPFPLPAPAAGEGRGENAARATVAASAVCCASGMLPVIRHDDQGAPGQGRAEAAAAGTGRVCRA